MNGPNFNNNNSSLRVLICPLDWGLGHASRCIPIISELLKLGCEVQMAADGRSYDLLATEFPQLKIFHLPGYNVQYAANKRNLKWKLIAQIPHIIKTIFKENRWLKSYLKTNKVDVLISDNRFGLYNKSIKTIFITHQLLIKTGNRFTERIGLKINYHFINKFSECWIPDAEKDGLGGELSHPKKLPANFKYLGPISRFKKVALETQFDRLFVLSGPEPQRTILEKIIINQAESLYGKNLLIRGVSNAYNSRVPKNFEVMDLVSSEKLNSLICQSKIVVSRAGYSTVMDLAKLNSKALLIPTPGQTEQEYLSAFLSQNNMFSTAFQYNLTKLTSSLKSIEKFQPIFKEYNWNQYQSVLEHFIKTLKSSTFTALNKQIE